ncbi:WbqC family protein [Petrocella sp. FN5]|uniref:WbqC family protein n=1 Tax=Petrocella sp. FN5 TaxID=3032002 RepID=UPI0023DCD2B0|nr:WbqC family protein [Petrocella sp. FN5]MDF1618116.1 WbqC family protein [Petrocella sp. FN5]
MIKQVESVALMQPYFFPYLGYYSVIDQADVFVVFDEVQYIRQGWMNRNRILSDHGAFAYINMPVKKAPLKTVIKEIRIQQALPWKEKLRQDLSRYKDQAPYYKEAMEVVEACLAYETDSLTQFHVHSLKQVMAYIGLESRMMVLSELNLELPKIQAPDEWGLYVTLALGGKTYYNPPGGMDFYDPAKYTDHGAQVLFVRNKLKPYNQGRDCFVPGMSIIDGMMFMPPSELLAQVRQYGVEKNL